MHGLFAVHVVSSSVRPSNSWRKVNQKSDSSGLGYLSFEPLFAEMCLMTKCCLAQLSLGMGERQQKRTVNVRERKIFMSS